MKNKKTAAILALLLGGVGGHRFYLGQTGKGTLSVLFCWTFIPSIIGLYDFFVFALMSKEYFQVTYNNDLSLHCSVCKIQLLVNTISYWGLGENNGACNNCFSKIRQQSKVTGKYEFSDEEAAKILKGEIKDRPLPNTDLNKYSVAKDEINESYDLPDDINILKLNTLAHISYSDAKGQRSERRITMKAIQKTYDDDYIITAYCHEKQAQRSFKLSRIDKLVDMETGEVFSDPSKYFIDRFMDSPIGHITQCFQEYEPEILVLSFMARADGVLRKKERKLIADYIQHRYNSTLDEKLLDDEIRRTYCESSDFRKSLKTISDKSEIDRIQILEYITDIANADKNIDPMEAGILELVSRELKLEKASR
ncbi:MAG TPA: NINE protein [Edaphocola sp.]|nr:NINE protein [Edaphocola sp.]